MKDKTTEQLSQMIREDIESAFTKIDHTSTWEDLAEEWESDFNKESKALEEAVWTVETKIADNGRSVEVSAVIKGSHGHKSWGWHRPEQKYVVLSVSNLYQQVPVLQSIIALAEDEARKICRQNNK